MSKFVWRKYVSVGLALSFMMIVISGSVLYIAPPGRIARWINWGVLGLNRAEWETQHTLFSYLFIIFGVIHLFSMNWKAFISYFTNGIANKIRSKKESLLALVTVVLIFLFTLYKVPPVISVMTLGNSISDTWSESINQPPVAGIESMSLGEIAYLFFNSDTTLVVHILREEGCLINSHKESINDIASVNEVSPMFIYNLLKD